MTTTLPFMVCLFWAVLLLLEWKRTTAPQHLLAMFMVMAMMLYLCHALFFNRILWLRGLSESVYALCNIGVFPMYYLYICRLTQSHPIRPAQWLFLLPALLIGLWCGIDYLCCPAAESVRIAVARIIFVLQLIPIAWFGTRQLVRFDRSAEEFYSTPEGRNVRSTRRMTIVLLVCAAISLIAGYLGRQYFMDRQELLCIPSLLFSGCLYAVGYVGMCQRFDADALAREEREIAEDAQPGTDEQPQMVAPDYTRLCQLMEEHKWYLRNDLRLPDLALFVGLGRSRLSALINENSGMSFSDFINSYRVLHAKQLIMEAPEGKDPVLAHLCEECGFSSESSFYRAFRKFTGMTPARWRRCQG